MKASRSYIRQFFWVLFCIGFVFTNTVMVQAQNTNVNSTEYIIEEDGMVADTFMGVDAIYRPGPSAGSDVVYSCAAYVKKYYKAVYGVTPYNLLHKRTPLVGGDSFVQIATPKVGDIVAEIGANSNHWSIVKQVKTDSVIVIDQNFKWKGTDGYYVRINRELSMSNVQFFRLKSLNKDPVVNISVDDIPVVDVPEDDGIGGGTSGNGNTNTASLSLSRKSVTLDGSKKEKIVLKAIRSNIAITSELTFTTSNPKVATVSAYGLVKSVGKGTATITVKAQNNLTAACTVQVK